MEGFMVRGWDLITPGEAGPRRCLEGQQQNLDAGWLYEPQLRTISRWGVRFPHRVGRYRPEAPPVSPPD